MAAKEYKINIGGKVIRTMANSAQQAAKRAEKLHAAGGHAVNQKTNVSNVTRKSVADAPGVKVARTAGAALKGKQVKPSVRTAKQKAASKRNLVAARKSR